MVLGVWLIFLLIISLVPISVPKIRLPADKIEHFMAYGITAILFYRYYVARGRKTGLVFVSVLTSSSYGALIEVLQGLTPHRQFSVGDIAANTAGAAVFCLAYAVMIGNRNPDA
jgi:VanZ family protein